MKGVKNKRKKEAGIIKKVKPQEIHRLKRKKKERKRQGRNKK